MEFQLPKQAKDLTNKQFGFLTVSHPVGQDFRNRVLWACKCKCGKNKTALASYLLCGDTVSCGCKTRQIKDLSGQKFNRLTAIKVNGVKKKWTTWECKCDCGNIATVIGTQLQSGRVKSCGCLLKENRASLVQKGKPYHFAPPMKDRVGERFGLLQIVSHVGRDKYNRFTWRCKCGCGNEKTISYHKLRYGGIKSCGCLMKKCRIVGHKIEDHKIDGHKSGGCKFDITNRRFGRLIAQKLVGHNKERAALWECKCDCGGTKITRGTFLRCGKTKSCGCLEQERQAKAESAVKRLMRLYLKHSAKRNHLFNLNEEEFSNLISRDCFYCGIKPLQKLENQRNYKDFVYNGIDRLDPQLGYTKENCVPCCAKHNQIKWTLPLAEFKQEILFLAERAKAGLW